MSLNQQKWVFNYLIREKIWKKLKKIWLRNVMDTAESVSSLLMKSLSLTPLYQWHRWVCLLVINDIAEIDFTVLMTLQIFCLKIYYLHKTDFIFENISLSGSESWRKWGQKYLGTLSLLYNVKRRNQWILRKDAKDVIKLSSPPVRPTAVHVIC